MADVVRSDGVACDLGISVDLAERRCARYNKQALDLANGFTYSVREGSK